MLRRLPHRTCRTKEAGLRAALAESDAHRAELAAQLTAARKRADAAEEELARIVAALGTDVETATGASA